MKCPRCHSENCDYRESNSTNTSDGIICFDRWRCQDCGYVFDEQVACSDDQEPDSSGGWDGGDSPDDDDDDDGGTRVVHRPSDDLDDIFSQLGQG